MKPKVKPKLIKQGCFWVVLRPNFIYGWAYTHCYDTWKEALVEALKPFEGRL